MRDTHHVHVSPPPSQPSQPCLTFYTLDPLLNPSCTSFSCHPLLKLCRFSDTLSQSCISRSLLQSPGRGSYEIAICDIHYKYIHCLPANPSISSHFVRCGRDQVFRRGVGGDGQQGVKTSSAVMLKGRSDCFWSAAPVRPVSGFGSPK
ncbi:hypothetical protein CDEST_06631 [Colletotrichum destructivum]|uniref:Uncharacterized protein n=1 Tax=Colletotrichum destructivum TaxID=34406 RepID=A0AAX4IEG1_9PEZI|nr:hypothetical protein CDEST_06631 [Colletotrichum destructivum]